MHSTDVLIATNWTLPKASSFVLLSSACFLLWNEWHEKEEELSRSYCFTLSQLNHLWPQYSLLPTFKCLDLIRTCGCLELPDAFLVSVRLQQLALTAPPKQRENDRKNKGKSTKNRAGCREVVFSVNAVLVQKYNSDVFGYMNRNIFQNLPPDMEAARIVTLTYFSELGYLLTNYYEKLTEADVSVLKGVNGQIISQNVTKFDRSWFNGG